MKAFIPTLFVTMVLTGCVETFVMDPHEKDLPVVVNCVLNAGKGGTQTLYLQYVKGKSMDTYIPITDAKVYIKSSRSNRITEFLYIEGNEYETSDPFLSIGQGETYTLWVEIPGRETIMASTAVPLAVSPDLHSYSEDKDTVTFNAPFDDLYYRADLESTVKSSPVWVFANKWKHVYGESEDNRFPYLVTDHPYADQFNITSLKFSDLVIEGGPESGDTHLRYTWPTLYIMRQKMPNLPVYDGFIRIDHLDGTPFHLIAGPLKYKESYQDHFDLFFVSEEYDKYLRSVYTRTYRMGHDLTSVYSTGDTYSNIEGGVGFFGSVVCVSIPLISN